jgi:hypothetical protein
MAVMTQVHNRTVVSPSWKVVVATNTFGAIVEWYDVVPSSTCSL